jgi:hypothetical protein
MQAMLSYSLSKARVRTFAFGRAGPSLHVILILDFFLLSGFLRGCKRILCRTSVWCSATHECIPIARHQVPNSVMAEDSAPAVDGIHLSGHVGSGMVLHGPRMGRWSCVSLYSGLPDSLANHDVSPVCTPLSDEMCPAVS